MIKSFILKLWPFSWAYREGGKDAFPLASKDIWETMKDEVDRRGTERAKQMTAELLTLVDEKAIVGVDKRGLVFIGGELATDDRLSSLKSEAEYFKESDLWKILNETPKRLAEKAMFEEGDSIDAMKKGRSMLYLLSTQRNIINTFLSYKKKELSIPIPS